jgi:hypothetical protein
MIYLLGSRWKIFDEQENGFETLLLGGFVVIGDKFLHKTEIIE